MSLIFRCIGMEQLRVIVLVPRRQNNLPLPGIMRAVGTQGISGLVGDLARQDLNRARMI
jgi:hypothetical protein